MEQGGFLGQTNQTGYPLSHAKARNVFISHAISDAAAAQDWMSVIQIAVKDEVRVGFGVEATVIRKEGQNDPSLIQQG